VSNDITPAKEAVLQEAFNKKDFCKFVSSSLWDPTETISYDSWSELQTVLQKVATCVPQKLFSRKCAPQKSFSRCHFGSPRKLFSESCGRSRSCSLRLCRREHFQIFWAIFLLSTSLKIRGDFIRKNSLVNCVVTESSHTLWCFFPNKVFWMLGQHTKIYAPLSKTVFFLTH